MTQDNRLFTPGPLTTSTTVKAAMQRDLGSRDHAFIERVQEIRNKLLALAGQSQESGFEAILMQGSGTFGMEAVISSVIQKTGHLLLLINGAYGRRIRQMCDIHGIPCTALTFPEDEIPDEEAVSAMLHARKDISHLAMVHCETTSGIFNRLSPIGKLAKARGVAFIVDAMSSFGAVPVDLEAAHIDYLVSSANKCIEGVPGFSFVIARKSSLLKSKGHARTLSLDLYHQWEGLEQNGQFRFTPPTHTLLAFYQALLELEEEGGVTGRARRYQQNHSVLSEGMRGLGFQPYLPSQNQGYIITTFHYPQNPAFSFDAFYKQLNREGFTIYPGKLTRADCFRIGNIGRLNEQDMYDLLAAIKRFMNTL